MVAVSIVVLYGRKNVIYARGYMSRLRESTEARHSK